MPFYAPLALGECSCVLCNQEGAATGLLNRRMPDTGLFEVQKINPPPKSLGIHNLPVDTHNGDQITVEDEVGIPKKHASRRILICDLQGCLLILYGIWASSWGVRECTH